jgi:hypothetical protein
MQTLKKLTLLSLVAASLSGSLSSCATVFGGHITQAQKHTPLPGEPKRELRVGALVADVLLFWPSLGIDFATSAIYKPQPSSVVAPATSAQPAPVKAELQPQPAQATTPPARAAKPASPSAHPVAKTRR